MANSQKSWLDRVPEQERLYDGGNDSDSEADLVLKRRRGGCWLVDSPSPWMFSTLLFALLSCFLLLRTEIAPIGMDGSWSIGLRPGELVSVGSQIHAEIKRFTGGATFSSTGEESRRPAPDGLEYVGQPSDEMDQRWRDLEEVNEPGRYFLLTEDEAKASWGSDYKQFYNNYAGGYLATLEMYHLIHCLDHLRQSFYPDRYPHAGVHGEMHRDHCIDSLRQMLLCNSDVTPIPTRWYPSVGIDFHYVDSDVVHTCRNFDKIRHWTWKRVNGSLMVQPNHHNDI